MKTVIIIQARMGSTRVEGKVLMDIGGKTMLERVIERCQKSNADSVMVATTENVNDDAIVELCGSIGVDVYRGSEEDVLDRYKQAADSSSADVIVRVTSDCPLIDPDILNEIIDKFHSSTPDYASNVLERTYPRGLDTEVIAKHALDRVWEEADKKHEREHVTAHILENMSDFSVLSVTGSVDNSDHRWTVDTEEDLALIRAIYENLGSSGDFGWTEVLELLDLNPEIRKLNEGIEQKSLHE